MDSAAEAASVNAIRRIIAGEARRRLGRQHAQGAEAVADVDEALAHGG